MLEQKKTEIVKRNAIDKKELLNIEDSILKSLSDINDINDMLTIHSNDIYDIVQQYYWKQYKKGKKYTDIYESSPEHYEEFIEEYEDQINLDTDNYINFIK